MARRVPVPELRRGLPTIFGWKGAASSRLGRCSLLLMQLARVLERDRAVEGVDASPPAGRSPVLRSSHVPDVAHCC